MPLISLASPTGRSTLSSINDSGVIFVLISGSLAQTGA